MENRITKFAKKISGEIRGKRYDAQKDEMVRLEKIASDDFEIIENQVKGIIDGEPVILHHFYMAFAKEIYSKQKRYKGQTLINELRILDDKWERRGLNPALLTAIKTFYVPSYYVPALMTCFEESCFEVSCFA